MKLASVGSPTSTFTDQRRAVRTMGRYDYANGKIRTLSSRLLTSAEFEEMRRLPSIEALMMRLAGTEYHRDLDRALESASGLGAITEACKRNVVNACRNVSTFYDAEGQRLLDVITVRFDIHNLRVLFRSLRERKPFHEIVDSLLPAGFLDEKKLRRLATHIDPRAMVATLATMHAAYGRAGREAIAAFQSTNDWLVAEAVFESHLYLALLGRTSRGSDNDRTASAFLAGEIDARNILTVLRIRSEKRRLDESELQRRIVFGGTVDIRKLAALGEAPDDRAARAILRTIEVTTGSEFVIADSVHEAVEEQLQRWGASFLKREGDTIAPGIGYIEAKRMEAGTIVRIAREIAGRGDRDLFAERLRQVS